MAWTSSSLAGDPPVVADSPVTSQDTSIQYKSLDAYLTAMTPSLITSAPGKIGLAVGAVMSGRVAKYYFGETALGGGKVPDGTTLFEIASISKTFTATLLALYVEQHLVNLDDPIQKYLPDGITAPLFNNDANHPITLSHLAEHTSGLGLMPVFPFIVTGPISTQKLFTSLNQAQLTAPPGSKYIYSNYGYALLGQILARAGNKEWMQLNLDAIANPLSMQDTKIWGQLTADEISRLAPGNNVTAGAWTFFPAENPAGGLYSTLNDMTRYLTYAMGLGHTSLDSLLPSLFQPQHGAGYLTEIGLGWYTSNLPGTSEQVIWKDGGLLGYESYIGFVPGKGIGVVMMINSEGVNIDGLGQQTLAFLLANPNQNGEPIISQPQVDPVDVPQLPGPGPVENQIH